MESSASVAMRIASNVETHLTAREFVISVTGAGYGWKAHRMRTRKPGGRCTSDGRLSVTRPEGDRSRVARDPVNPAYPG